MRPRADDDANFVAPISNSQRAAFNAATPNRFAFKHAHSQQNPEQDWGRNVLRSIEFAFDVLNDKFGRHGRRIGKHNTVVIASSVSNGGGASVLAVEQDDDGLIDGLAVGEPNVNPKFRPDFTIVQGGGAPFSAHSKPLMDYTTLVNVYQGCADLAPANATAPLNLAPSAQRCADLHTKGLLAATVLADQATEAQAKDQRLWHLARAEPGAARLLVRQRAAVDLGDLRQCLWPLRRARQSLRL